LARPSPPSDPPGAERKLVTVLLIDVDEAREGFADVDPEDAGRSLPGRLARVRAEVEAHGGVVEETLGGRTVAVFGIPRTRDDDPERAVRAALAVRDTLAREASPELRVQAAVVTGEALVRPGEGGWGRQRVTGDPLAAATRLQETVPAGTVLVSETTRRATERAIAYGPAGQARPGAGEPLTAWPALAPRTGPASPSRRFPPLVARDRELDALLAATARAAAGGGPALVTVVGAAGIGKSRLLAELADLLATGPSSSGGLGLSPPDQIAWRQGRALPYGDGPTFGALAEAVKAEAGILESDGAELAGRRLVAAAGAVADPVTAAWVAGHLRRQVGVGAGRGGTGGLTTAADRELTGGDEGTAEGPCLSELEELIGQSAAAGMVVELSVEGETRGYAPKIEQTAYRVVQEALTNVHKHAAGAKTQVRLAHRMSEIAMQVENGPPPEPASASSARLPSGGNGLVGMKERVVALGGVFVSGPTDAGGFRVSAVIPAA